MSFDIAKFLALTTLLATGVTGCETTGTDDGAGASGAATSGGAAPTDGGGGSAADGGAGGNGDGGAVVLGGGIADGGSGGGEACLGDVDPTDEAACSNVSVTDCDPVDEALNPAADSCWVTYQLKSEVANSIASCLVGLGDICIASPVELCLVDHIGQACPSANVDASCTTINTTCDGPEIWAEDCAALMSMVADVFVPDVLDCMDPNSAFYDDTFSGTCEERLRGGCLGLPY